MTHLFTSYGGYGASRYPAYPHSVPSAGYGASRYPMYPYSVPSAGYGNFGAVLPPQEPLKKKFNWGDVGVGAACFGVSLALGVVATAILTRAEPQAKGIRILAPLVPATAAGFLGYMLRRECPPCEIPDITYEPAEIIPEFEREPALIGYRSFGLRSV